MYIKKIATKKVIIIGIFIAFAGMRCWGAAHQADAGVHDAVASESDLVLLIEEQLLNHKKNLAAQKIQALFRDFKARADIERTRDREQASEQALIDKKNLAAQKIQALFREFRAQPKRERSDSDEDKPASKRQRLDESKNDDAEPKISDTSVPGTSVADTSVPSTSVGGYFTKRVCVIA